MTDFSNLYAKSSGGKVGPSQPSSGGRPNFSSMYAGYHYQAPPTPTPQQLKVISSFKMLDSNTRSKLLTTFQKTNPDKYNLLAQHAGDNLSGSAGPNGNRESTKGIQIKQPNGIMDKIYRGERGVANAGIQMGHDIKNSAITTGSTLRTLPNIANATRTAGKDVLLGIHGSQLAKDKQSVLNEVHKTPYGQYFGKDVKSNNKISLGKQLKGIGGVTLENATNAAAVADPLATLGKDALKLGAKALGKKVAGEDLTKLAAYTGRDALKTTAKSAAANAAYGGSTGLSESLKQDKSLKDTLVNTGSNAALGAAVGGLTGGLGARGELKAAGNARATLAKNASDGAAKIRAGIAEQPLALPEGKSPKGLPAASVHQPGGGVVGRKLAPEHQAQVDDLNAQIAQHTSGNGDRVKLGNQARQAQNTMDSLAAKHSLLHNVSHEEAHQALMQGPVKATKNADAREVVDSLAQEHADHLRQLDRENGGVTTTRGEDGMVNGRVSTNSPFYSKFYKQYGKPPTKADYLNEAHQQLSRGTDENARMYQQAKSAADGNASHTDMSRQYQEAHRVLSRGTQLAEGQTKASGAAKLNELLGKRQQVYDEVHNSPIKAGPDEKPVSKTQARTQRIDSALNDFHNGKSDLTPDQAKQLFVERQKLAHQGALDSLAQDHATKTGQPLEAAHQTLAAGHGEHGELYNDIKQSASHPAIGHDVPDFETKKAQVDQLSEDAPNRSAEAEKQGGSLRRAYTQAKGLFNPIGASNLSRASAQTLSEARATGENLGGELRAQNNRTLGEKLTGKNKQAPESYFNGKSDDENIANISHYERTGVFKDEPHSGYSREYQAEMDKAHETIAGVYGDDKVGYIDNYVRRNLKFENPEEASSATNILARQFGSKSPTKGRTLDMPIDEALAKLKEAGINAKPITTNPETLRQWTVVNAHKAQAFQDAYEAHIKEGLVATSHKPGMVSLPRDTVQALAPKMAGTDHYAYPEVARVLKNATGKGMRDGDHADLYKMARKTSAGIGQITLAMPTFHTSMTVMHSATGELANAFLQLQKGQVGGGLKSLANSATIVGPTIKNYLKGRDFMQQVRSGQLGPEAKAVLNASGGRLAMGHEFESGATHAIKEAIKQIHADPTLGTIAKEGAKTVGLSPFAAAEQIAKPLMQGIIPKVKLGALMERAGQIGLDDKEGLAQASRAIDNRLGEVIMDNKFWHPMVRDLGQLLYLSVGYRSGTIGEIGGGLVDTASRNWLKQGLTERQAFTLATPIIAAYVGTLYQAAHTGKLPSNFGQALFPMNGQTDKNGNQQRVQLPGYMKDLWNLTHGQPGKVVSPTGPGFTIASELLSNKDWKGDYIRNPNDSVMTQGQQVLSHLLGSVVPIIAQNATKDQPINKTESILGVGKAPAELTQSKAQQEIYKLLGASAPKTPEEQAKAQQKSQTKPSTLQDLFDKLPDDKKAQFFKELKPSDYSGKGQVNFDKFKYNSVQTLKTGNAKDPESLKGALKAAGLNTKNSDAVKQWLDKGKAQRHQQYLNHKAKGKTPSQL